MPNPPIHSTPWHRHAIAWLGRLRQTAGRRPGVGFALACAAGLGLAPNAGAQYYNVFESDLASSIVLLLQHRTPITSDGNMRTSAQVVVAAHRGIADKDHPENSLQSISLALSKNIEAIELDVYLSSDGVPYLMHDQKLSRMTGAPQYSDIYRWQREAAAPDLKTPDWFTISQLRLCLNGADGRGQTVDHNVCNSGGEAVPSLADALNLIYQNSYQGMIFLDLRETGDVVDTAALLTHYVYDGGAAFGEWVSKHLVLKFQTSLFTSPNDYFSQVISKYQGAYFLGLSHAALSAALYVQPVYTSNTVAQLNDNGQSNWALNDYLRWVDEFTADSYGNSLLPPLVGLKAPLAVLNTPNDDIFSYLWRQGKSIGVYVPIKECTLSSPSSLASNLTGSDGVYQEGGVCGAIVPSMSAGECGAASTTSFAKSGAGCTDHRPFYEYWHDTAQFGFIITDDPVGTIDRLGQNTGQRPATTSQTITVIQHTALQVIVPPASLSAVQASATSVVLTWQASQDPASPGKVDASVSQYSILRGPSAITVSPAAVCNAGGSCSYTVTGLTAGKTYAFSIAASSSNGDSAPSRTSLATVSDGLLVAADGSGSYKTVAAAVAALPDTGGIIQIKAGVYNEKVLIAKPNVSLIGLGSDASQVRITNNDYAAKINPATQAAYGTGNSYTLSVSGSNFYATNLTIENTANDEAPLYQDSAQAVALLSTGDRQVFRAVRILGGQDTLYLKTGRSYFANCYVQGNVDYIFGDGKVVFDSCTLKTRLHGSLNDENTITAQSRVAGQTGSGFVFRNSQLLFDSRYMNNVFLGRPWQPYSTVYYVNTKMGKPIKTEGWIEFVPGSTNNLPTATYREFNSLYPVADTGDGESLYTAFAISQRESVSRDTNVALTQAEADALAPDVFLGGTDGWVPSGVSFGALTAQTLPIPTPAYGVPSAPRITGVTGGNGNLQIAWAPTVANPETTGYTVSAQQNGQTYGPVSVPATATSAYIAGLANGAAATISLSEFNALGSSTKVSGSATPAANDPSVPTNITFQSTSTASTMTLDVLSSGANPVFGGTVAHAGIYTALYASELDAYAGNALAGTSNGFTGKQWVFNGLAAKTTYWVSLRAYNGAWSPTVITSFTTP